MRLLYFATHQMWPLTSGNRLRDYYLATELAKRASVTFVEMCHAGEEPSCPPNKGVFERVVSLRKSPGYTPVKVVRGLAGPTPLTVLNYFDSKSASQLAKLITLQRFDALQVEGVHLSTYLPVFQGTPNCPGILIDWQNIESELMWRYSENTSFWPKRAVARRTATLLERFETRLLGNWKRHTVVSERERENLLRRCPSATVDVVPNGVDTSFFSAAQISEVAKSIQPAKSKRTILFVGSMDYHANIDGATWFTREIWPEIAEKHPELLFMVVGRNPAGAVKALTSERIRVTGTVEDVRPFYASAVAVVVPLRIGSGTRLKILEAMAAGVPVVSTGLGVEGIDATPNTHFLLADDRASMVAAIDQMISSPIRLRIVEAARQFVVKHHDWAIAGEKLYQILRQLAQKPT